MPKPIAAYPASIAGDPQLAIAVNRFQTKLAAAIGVSDTQMLVLDSSNIVPDMLLSLDLDGEIVRVIGPPVGNAVTISRGFDGTTPKLHLGGATVSGLVDAYHHNALVAEVQAIEQALGANLANIGGTNLLTNTGFIFTPQAPGGNLIVGVNVITLTPVPKGVNGSDTGHNLYISGGTGAAEAVPIIGGTAVSGAATGTVIVQCANTHSGAWTIQSATAGLQEALTQLPAGGLVQCPAGTYTIQGLTTVSAPHVTITGDGAVFIAAAGARLGTMLSAAPAATGFRLDGITLDGNQANLGTILSGGFSWLLNVSASNAVISRCEIRNGATFGIFVGETSVSPSNVLVFNCYVHHNGSPSQSGVGIYTGGGAPPTEIRVLCNRFENNCTPSGILQASGAISITANGSLVEGNFCLNNYNVAGGQIYIDNSGNRGRAVVRGNTVLRTGPFLSDATHGVEIFGQNSILDGNIFDGAQQYGISLQCSYSIAVNNIVTNTPVGVLVEQNPGSGPVLISHITVANNQLQATLTGIETNTATDVLIYGNNLTGCPTPFLSAPADTFQYFGNSPFLPPINTTPVTVANTTTNTALKNLVVPANYLFPGRVIRLSLWGIYNSAGAAGDFLVLGLLDNTLGITLMGTATAATAQTNAPWFMSVMIACVSAGASGSITYMVPEFVPNQLINSNFNNGLYTLNTTIARVFTVAAQWNAAKPGNSILVQGLTVEEL